MNRIQSKELATALAKQKLSLIICGGGHVGYYVEQLGRMLDFAVTVVDDRPEFANKDRFPKSNVICAPFEEAIEYIKEPENCYFVLVSRGHAYDVKSLEAVLKKGFKYAGMMGSKAKIKLIMDRMRTVGFEEALLEKVHTPIGMKIGAVTPAEIGVSIAAELIQVKNGQNEAPYVGSDVIEAIQTEEAMVIATIISKSGSTPCGVGSTLVLKKDGTTVGTVGGGKVEYVATERAKQLVGTGVEEVLRCNMATKGENKVGMVCGGEVEMLLQSIVES